MHAAADLPEQPEQQQPQLTSQHNAPESVVYRTVYK